MFRKQMSSTIALKSQMQTFIRNFQRSLPFWLALPIQFTGGLRLLRTIHHHTSAVPDTPFCAALRIAGVATPRSEWERGSENRADAPACYSSILENRWNVAASTLPLFSMYFILQNGSKCVLRSRREVRAPSLPRTGWASSARSPNDQSLRIPTFVSRFSRFYITHRSRRVCVLPSSWRRRSSTSVLDPRLLIQNDSFVEFESHQHAHIFLPREWAICMTVRSIVTCLNSDSESVITVLIRLLLYTPTILRFL